MTPNRHAMARVLELVRLALTAEEHGRVAPATPVGPATERPVEAAELLEAASRHRVVELLYTRREELALADQFGASLVEALAVHHAHVRRHVAVQTLEIRRLMDLFDAAGIPALTFKGPALAMQTTGSVAARGVGDIDLFIAPESVEPALAVLRRNGWNPRAGASAEPGSWAWRHLLGTYYEITFDGSASTVDLHWRLDPNAQVLPAFDRAWSRHEVIDLGFGPIPCLDVRTAFLHTCQHAAKDDWRWLRSLVDVRRLVRLPEVRELVSTELATQGGQIRATIALTQHVVGLPPGVEETSPRWRHLRRASRSQSCAARPDRPVPMAQSLRDLRYRLVASRTTRDVVGALSSAAVPVHSLEGLADRTAWTAVPKLVVRRARRLLAQWRRWMTGDPRSAPADPRPGALRLEGSDR